MTHPERIGNYQITEELARGGQGVVYKGLHPRLGNVVAIKILLDQEPKSIKRFKQEAKVLARIRHPNLLQVTDFGDYIDTQGQSLPYMVMEYVDGTDLKVVLHDGIPFLQWTIETISTIGNVLDKIHQHGIIHRDLKPANILLEKHTNRPVLIDFGLVKRDISKMGLGSLDKSRLTATGEIAGTAEYMAPEQVDSLFGELGPWTDVYGLAATLFHLVTKQTPFKGGSLAIFSKLMTTDSPPRPKRN